MRAKISFLQKNGTMKPYEYEFQKPKDDTIEALAFAISNAKHLKEHKTKFTGVPDSYELILGMLKGKNIQFSGISTGKTDYFAIASERNNLEHPEKKKDKIVKTKWRVGVTFSNRLVIDIDGHDEKNLKLVSGYYSNIFNDTYTVFKTLHGYWIIFSKRYEDKKFWIYDNCRLLVPELSVDDYPYYLKKLLSLEGDKLNWKPVSSIEFAENNKLFQGIGSFDIAFTRLSIKRERHTLRLSKKEKGDSLKLLTQSPTTTG